jgi:hypothetical protein
VLARLASAVFFSGLAAAFAGGCGGDGDSVASLESARACLEAEGADVLAPPPRRFDDLTYGVGSSGPFTFAHAGLPSGGVVAVGFPRGPEDVASARAALENRASLADGAPRIESAADALVWWRHPAGTGDRELLLSCLESGGEVFGSADTDPANPLGCVRVYLAAGASTVQKERIEETLLDQRSTREVRYVSKAEALAALRERNPELAENLHGNPLPDSFEAGPTRGEEAPSIADAVRGSRGIDELTVSSLPCSVSAAPLSG